MSLLVINSKAAVFRGRDGCWPLALRGGGVCSEEVVAVGLGEKEKGWVFRASPGGPVGPRQEALALSATLRSQRMVAPSSPPTALRWLVYFCIDDKLSLRN